MGWGRQHCGSSERRARCWHMLAECPRSQQATGVLPRWPEVKPSLGFPLRPGDTCRKGPAPSGTRRPTMCGDCAQRQALPLPANAPLTPGGGTPPDPCKYPRVTAGAVAAGQVVRATAPSRLPLTPPRSQSSVPGSPDTSSMRRREGQPGHKRLGAPPQALPPRVPGPASAEETEPARGRSESLGLPPPEPAT